MVIKSSTTLLCPVVREEGGDKLHFWKNFTSHFTGMFVFYQGFNKKRSTILMDLDKFHLPNSTITTPPTTATILKICRNICVEEKLKFFVNYEKWSQQSRNFHWEALNFQKCYGFQRFTKVPCQVAHSFSYNLPEWKTKKRHNLKNEPQSLYFQKCPEMMINKILKYPENSTGKQNQAHLRL